MTFDMAGEPKYENFLQEQFYPCLIPVLKLTMMLLPMIKMMATTSTTTKTMKMMYMMMMTMMTMIVKMLMINLRWALTATLNMFLKDELTKALSRLFARKKRFHLKIQKKYDNQENQKDKNQVHQTNLECQENQENPKEI